MNLDILQSITLQLDHTHRTLLHLTPYPQIKIKDLRSIKQCAWLLPSGQIDEVILNRLAYLERTRLVQWLHSNADLRYYASTAEIAALTGNLILLREVIGFAREDILLSAINSGNLLVIKFVKQYRPYRDIRLEIPRAIIHGHLSVLQILHDEEVEFDEGDLALAVIHQQKEIAHWLQNLGVLMNLYAIKHTMQYRLQTITYSEARALVPLIYDLYNIYGCVFSQMYTLAFYAQDLTALQWLHQKLPIWTIDGLNTIVYTLEIVQWLSSISIRIENLTPGSFQDAATVQWLLTQNIPLTVKFMRMVVRLGDLSLVQQFHTQMTQVERQRACHHPAITIEAAHSTNVALFLWLHEQGYRTDKLAEIFRENRASVLSLEMVQTIAQISTLPSRIYTWAACIKSLPILQWLYQTGHNIPSEVFDIAAGKYQYSYSYKIFRWGLDNGLSINWGNCLYYARENIIDPRICRCIEDALQLRI